MKLHNHQGICEVHPITKEEIRRSEAVAVCIVLNELRDIIKGDLPENFYTEVKLGSFENGAAEAYKFILESIEDIRKRY